jgi:hypothetical protein
MEMTKKMLKKADKRKQIILSGLRAMQFPKNLMTVSGRKLGGKAGSAKYSLLYLKKWKLAGKVQQINMNQSWNGIRDWFEECAFRTGYDMLPTYKPSVGVSSMIDVFGMQGAVQIQFAALVLN